MLKGHYIEPRKSFSEAMRWRFLIRQFHSGKARKEPLNERRAAAVARAHSIDMIQMTFFQQSFGTNPLTDEERLNQFLQQEKTQQDRWTEFCP